MGAGPRELWHRRGVPEKFADKPLLTERFDQAVLMALEHHRVHLRKGTAVPYASHVMAVTGIVLELGGGEDEAIAAMLHDAVEDGGGPMMLGRIRARFGDRTALMVQENSDTDEESKPPWPERKRRYLAAIPEKQPGSVLVSFADKLHNARAINADLAIMGESLWQRFNASPQQTIGYYTALRSAFANSSAGFKYDAAAYKIALSEFWHLVNEMAQIEPGRV